MLDTQCLDAVLQHIMMSQLLIQRHYTLHIKNLSLGETLYPLLVDSLTFILLEI